MDRIKIYVDRFFKGKGKHSNYGMSFNEIKDGIEEVCRITDINGAFDVVTTFFNFGYAKGYRAAMAEMKKER